MYYFKYNDTSIEKYLVHFNRNELINLRHIVITNCRELVHREIDSMNELNSNSRIINLKKSKISDVYHYSYDEYIYPKLVSLINMLLKNDDKAIEGILFDSQSDIMNINDEDKRNKLKKYYNYLERMLSFELLVTINFNEPEKGKPKTKRRLKRT